MHALMLAAMTATARRQTLPTAPGKRVVTLTARPGYYSEPSVAIDPTNLRRVVVAYQVGAHVAYSGNAGRSWRVQNVAPKNFKVSGDVSVTYDARGHAVLCYIAFDKLGASQYWAHGATRNGIYVLRSFDGGAHWPKREAPVIAHTGHPKLFEDKPYIVADDTHSRYRGNLYVGWTEFQVSQSIILFSRSTDGGAHWSKPRRINMVSGLPRDDNGALEGFDAAVSPDGTISAIWQDGRQILMTQSHDGGRTFGTVRSIVNVAPANYPLFGFGGRGANGFPQIAVDPRSGRLFVTWADYRYGEADIFAVTSDDGGQTWTTPTQVNSDGPHTARDHFFQWLSIDPRTGDAYVIFNDRRGDAHNVLATTTLARSTDGGRHFTNYAWTRLGFDPGRQFIGDYSGIAAYGGRVYGAWTEVAPGSNRRNHTVVRVGIARFAARP